MTGGRPPGELLRGIAGSPGLVVGRAVCVGKSRLPVPRRYVEPELADVEIKRFRVAVRDAQEQLREVATRRELLGGLASILDAHALMAGDEMLLGGVERAVREERRCAEWAVETAVEELARRLAAVADPYLSERARDLVMVGERILRALGGERTPQTPRFSEPSVVVAHDLSPADTAAMLREPVIAFVTERGTRTSHTAIMARALEIPAVLGVGDALGRIATGDLLVVDGQRGAVTLRPGPGEIDEARARAARHSALSRGLFRARHLPAATRDGTPVKLRANLELPSEAILARDHGADGVGLYRTEFLYIDRTEPPGEEEQLEVFRRVVEALHPHPVTLRTFDIGGDKFATSFQAPSEMNPMLGLRAVRLALSRPDVFLEQLRAMVRATAHGDVRIMIPMVAGLDEYRQVQRLLARAIHEVDLAGHRRAERIPLGVMIEVPSAAVMADAFAREAAFLSLGTNDLIQYALAIDRTSRSLAYLASPFDPAVVRLIAGVVRAGEAHECPVSICGAMASDPLAAVLLLGLGVRDFSMEAAAIAEIKDGLRRVTVEEAMEVARAALAASTAAEIERLVAEVFAPRLYDLLAGEDTSG